jgi:hypothetical protein
VQQSTNTPPRIYFDTDTFHNFAATFKKHSLPDELRELIVFSPMTMVEVFSHLAIGSAQEVHQQIQGLVNWVNAKHAVVLPWMDAAIARIAFGVALKDDGHAKMLEQGLNVLLNCELSEVSATAKARMEELSLMKTEYAGHFKTTVEYFRTIPLTQDAFTEIWLASIKRRSGLESNTKPSAEIVDVLSAYHEFEYAKLKVAVENQDYNFEKHRNDLFDAEQLVYLGDTSLHFLAIDRGYRSKVLNSPLRSRIHEVSRERLSTPKNAEAVLREIVASAGQVSSR